VHLKSFRLPKLVFNGALFLVMPSCTTLRALLVPEKSAALLATAEGKARKKNGKAQVFLIYSIFLLFLSLSTLRSFMQLDVHKSRVQIR